MLFHCQFNNPLFTLSPHSVPVTPWKKADLSKGIRRKGARKNWSTRRTPFLIIILIISVTQSNVRVASWLPAWIPSSTSRFTPCLTNFLPSQAGCLLLRRSSSFPPTSIHLASSLFLPVLGSFRALVPLRVSSLFFQPRKSNTAGLPATAHLSLTINDRLGKNKLIANLCRVCQKHAA